MDPIEQFNKEKQENIARMGTDSEVRELGRLFVEKTWNYKYSFNFTWMGRPVIQFPQDILAMQEIIWRIQPDLIIETGIAHGGSLVFYASMLELLGGEGEVLGIDIDIRAHNRPLIENHPMFKRITMIEGSSIDEEIAKQVYTFAEQKKQVLVALDSNHTHEHVLKELKLYSPLVKKGSYIVVFDTIAEDVPEDLYANRPWTRGQNPKTAVWEFLQSNDRFVMDKEIENKLLITVSYDGYLQCIKD